MKKTVIEKTFIPVEGWKQILLWIMKKSLFLFFVCVFNASAFASAQRITLDMGKVPLFKAFKQITRQTGVDFFYNDETFNANRVVTVSFNDVDLLTAVAGLVGNDYDVAMGSDHIVLISVSTRKRPEVIDELADTAILIKGRILDQDRKGIAGVNVQVKGTQRGVSSDAGGNYSLRADKNATLVISFIGYKKREVEVKGRNSIEIELEQVVADLVDVVISTGKVTRKLENFTGAVFKASGDELRAIGNRNVLQSLKSLDPSFVIVENNIDGSNPNALPKVEVRGKTSMTTNGVRDQFGGDPNQPLFILDGFESTIKDFYNLDINRVASILILKDAGSTALYGPKAANGVIVIETKRPTSGKLRVSYTTDLRADIPDLSDYNMMNAREKLDFEKKYGRWTSVTTQPAMDTLYTKQLMRVAQGLDSYWLGEPLRTGFTNGHSLYVEGGAQEFVYGLGLNYTNANGAMKGSDRKTWGANIDMNYRKKGLNIYNKLTINGIESNESPYGAFSTWANTNPIYDKYNKDGGIDKFLDNFSYDEWGTIIDIPNPLYNASLPALNNTKDLSIENRLQANYSWKAFRFDAGLALSKKGNTTETFVSPLNTIYDQVPVAQKGKYTNFRIDNSGYTIFAGVNYGRIFNGVHQISSNFRWEATENRNKLLGLAAVGFPLGSNGDPVFAAGYEAFGKPSTGLAISRSNSYQASVNYVYDNRFLVDLNYNISGSSLFGAEKKYSPFWSAGIGWNLHNERLLNINKKIINLLKLRAVIGVTGNQNLEQNLSTSVYDYNLMSNVFGQATSLRSLANFNLKSQNTKDISTGIDFALLNNRLSGYLNAYRKVTDPLIVVFDLPSSTGISNYHTNVGTLESKGVEFNLRYSPIYRLDKSIIWTIGVTGAMVKSTYGGFGNKLQSLNEKEEENASLIRYKDGYSPDDIWAVPSKGIDATTGYDIYEKSNGETTFFYTLEDVKRLGNSRPLMEGAINTNFNYKGFTLGVYLRYRFGGDQFNEALYNKVENIYPSTGGGNFDRRAYYDRWFKPGDIARYSKIDLEGGYGSGDTFLGLAGGGYAYPSSRFVQKDNNITGESISVGYQFPNQNWMKTIGINSFGITAITNDIFRASTIRAERGISYVYARYVSLSIRASF